MATTANYIQVDAETSKMLREDDSEANDRILADLAFQRMSEGQCIYCGTYVCRPWEKVSPVCWKCEND